MTASDIPNSESTKSASHAGLEGAAVASAERRRLSWVHWAPLLALLTLAAVAVAWLVSPGSRLFPPAEIFLDTRRTAEISKDINSTLVERLRILEDAVQGSQCTNQGLLVLPNGRLLDGTLPPKSAGDSAADGPDPIAVDAYLPPPPERMRVEQNVPGDVGTSTIQPTDLLTLLESQSVLVLTFSESGENLGAGSGFFVGPDLVVTNHHVVSDAGTVYITSASLRQLHEATVLAIDGPFKITGGDFSLLQVAGVSQPFFTLRDSTETMRLQNVISAGYPGAILETDAEFYDLMQGDTTASPELSVTQGIVNSEQTFDGNTQLLLHSALISPGNSGGPLIDYCGRVVGINTFTRLSDDRHINFSIASANLIQFLESAGISLKVDSGLCSPMAFPYRRAEN